MFRTRGTPETFEEHIDMSIRSTEGWYQFKGGAFVFNLIMVGDEAAGPIVSLLNAAPGSTLPVSPAHAHASDSFRVALKGHIHMDPDVYGPGEFRFQEGWRVYPGHGDVTYGDEGQWEIVIMGDSRGQKMRPAVEFHPNPENELLKHIAADFGMAGGDIFSDDPAHGAGPSAIVTTLAPRLRMGKLTGSYADAANWQAVAPGVRAAISLMGDPALGPVLVCTDVEPNGCAMPRARFGTELVRIVIAGSYRIGDRVYRQGDLRIQQPGAWCEEVHALDEGVRELIVLGDRRHIDAQAAPGTDWPVSIVTHAAALLKALADRPTPSRVAA
ncbi:hypothetical protein M9978_20435 [Sphingomonas sp. MG17]|jgi:hypothetical protein|uniref:ChrR Cupin-like domain-containing protein n=1 Tax=Sphingomonas tagetis TaxID=2949092 RepID=A0A9X2KNQ6_9SPHN|nr:hypothetical protein [Sphingomonas tagetis]MCP3732791.1 hypothetical protein [Sphingomonas tagetis]